MVRILERMELPLSDHHAVLNVGRRSNGKGAYELFPRYVPFRDRDGKRVPGEESKIAFCSPNQFVLDCISPVNAGKDAVGFEDGACLDDDLVACNRTVRAKSPVDGTLCLKPIPTLFQVDHQGKAMQVGELKGSLTDLWCKSFTPLPSVGKEKFALIRPIYSERSFEEYPRIMLCLWKQDADSSNLLSGLETIGLFMAAGEEEGLGISAPPVKTPIGHILFFHRIIWQVKDEKREYRHFAALLDKNDPTRIVASTAEPILSWRDFPRTPNVWIEGATYFRNLYYNESGSGSSIQFIVTESDRNNYWVEIPMTDLISALNTKES